MLLHVASGGADCSKSRYCARSVRSLGGGASFLAGVKSVRGSKRNDSALGGVGGILVIAVEA